jgi:hypothetical protein
MQIIEGELAMDMSTSHCDSEDDFLTLFGELTVSKKPIPLLSWLENELAAIDMENSSQPSCNA